MEIQELERFIDESTIISKANSLGKITYVNKKFTEVSGYSLDEVIGKDHSIVNSGEHTKDFWTDMYKTVLEGLIWNKVVTNRKKNGELYYVDTFIKAQFDSITGKLDGFMSIRQDVTDSRRKEIEMSNRMSAINSSNAVIEFDLDGNIKFVNDLFLKTLGYDSDSEIIGKHHNIFIKSELRDSDEYKNFWNRLKLGKFFSGEVARVKKDGTLIYLQSTYNPITGYDGKPYAVMKISTDITDTFNQRKEIEKLNINLNNLVSSQTSYVLRTDMQGRHTYWNQKFEDEFGWVYEGNMMNGNSLLSICESHHGIAYNAVMECISEVGKIVKVELDKPHKDGSRRSTLWEFVCLFDKDGNPFEVQCMGIDITDRVIAEKKIIEVLQEIEKKNTYLEHAAKIIRHDMHSGINTYIPRGLSSLERRLNEDIIKELKIDNPIKMIKEGLKHTQKVYKGVCEFTNLVKKDVVLEKKEFNLKSILYDYLSSTAYKSQVIIEDLGEYSVNEALFCTSIDNLIRNGLKYNDSDSKFVKITRIDDTIQVIDNGRGMSSEEFKFLSKPYTRKDGQKETGTGLGLNICIAILSEHGFDISCEKLLKGTKIKINLKND